MKCFSLTSQNIKISGTILSRVTLKFDGWPWKTNQSLNSQKTLHSSPVRVSYGVSVVGILEKIDIIVALHCTVKCRYNAVQFIMILLLWWQQQNINQISKSQRTSHISHSWVSYGVSVVTIYEKIDHVIPASYCIWSVEWNSFFAYNVCSMDCFILHYNRPQLYLANLLS